MNHESPSISETTKPMYLKIWHSEIVFSDAIWWRHNKSNMADSRHIANRLLAISPRFIVRLTRNFDMKKQYYVQILVTWAKYQNLKIQDGGRQPFWKWFHHYISAADHPISMKFGVPLHSLVPRTVNYKSIKILQSQNGGRPLCLWAIICRPTDLVGALR